ncbi:hypothetical protein [Streptococcus salivarius]|uniref:hypothetical protein n=1 Tax=Streptococcus salivarius TaxID=1304 RepID=UPI001FD33635|nr:hypothetical protein [Streptococcus salivarius]UOT89783.1 hypothetical protein LV497_05195 [Streptococcus salivarius]
MNRVTCFHCNYDEKIIEFVENHQPIISEHPFDNNWAGKGMYFWDNFDNANYWRGEKRKKSPASVSIVSVDVEYDTSDTSFLDLTSESILKKLIEYYKLTHPEENISDKKIGVLIDDYSHQNDVKVIKLLGDYKHNKSPNTPIDISKLSYKAKVIYCVKEKGKSNIIFNSIRKIEGEK